MIVTTGKLIKVQSGPITCPFRFERNCETPGRVTLHYDGQTINLPADSEQVESFVEGYRRVTDENIAYRTQECE